jgi:hypothetical protein
MNNLIKILVIIILLMIVVSVIVGVILTFFWTWGYQDFTTEKTGRAIQIQSISWD